MRRNPMGSPLVHRDWPVAAARGRQASFVIADAIVNRNLEETAKACDDRKQESQERFKPVASVVDTNEERELLKKAEADYQELV
jgi:hypothetical protein